MPDADQLRAYLADRDVPCPGCKYNLRDATTADCPECGEQLYLQQTLRSLGRGRVHWAWFVLPLVWHGFILANGLIGIARYFPSSVRYLETVIDSMIPLVAALLPAALLILAITRNWHRWQVPWVIVVGNIVGLVMPVAIVSGGFHLQMHIWM
ncbi:MAG: hypothetical protein AAFS11_06800 [Planctomycetota bacterium]